MLKRFLVIFVMLFCALGAGCQAEADAYFCCINFSYYDCEGSREADRCFESEDGSGCEREPLLDALCLL